MTPGLAPIHSLDVVWDGARLLAIIHTLDAEHSAKEMPVLLHSVVVAVDCGTPGAPVRTLTLAGGHWRWPRAQFAGRHVCIIEGASEDARTTLRLLSLDDGSVHTGDLQGDVDCFESAGSACWWTQRPLVALMRIDPVAATSVPVVDPTALGAAMPDVLLAYPDPNLAFVALVGRAGGKDRDSLVLRLLRVGETQPLALGDGGSAHCEFLGWSPTGRCLAWIEGPSAVRIRRVADGREVRLSLPNHETGSHKTSFGGVAVLDDGERIAIPCAGHLDGGRSMGARTSEDGTPWPAWLWNARSGERVLIPGMPTGDSADLLIIAQTGKARWRCERVALEPAGEERAMALAAGRWMAALDTAVEPSDQPEPLLRSGVSAAAIIERMGAEDFARLETCLSAPASGASARAVALVARLTADKIKGLAWRTETPCEGAAAATAAAMLPVRFGAIGRDMLRDLVGSPPSGADSTRRMQVHRLAAAVLIARALDIQAIPRLRQGLRYDLPVNEAAALRWVLDRLGDRVDGTLVDPEEILAKEGLRVP
jgi:hypothetical protein